MAPAGQKGHSGEAGGSGDHYLSQSHTARTKQSMPSRLPGLNMKKPVTEKSQQDYSSEDKVPASQATPTQGSGSGLSGVGSGQGSGSGPGGGKGDGEGLHGSGTGAAKTEDKEQTDHKNGMDCIAHILP